jgi:hypothetical protein
MAFGTRLARSRVRPLAHRSRRRRSLENTCGRPSPIPARPSSGRDLRCRRSKPRRRGRSDLCPFPGSVPFARRSGQRAPTPPAGHSGTFSGRLGRVGHFRGVDAEQTNPLTANLDGVAINDRGPASDFRRGIMGRDDKRHGEEENQAAHREGSIVSLNDSRPEGLPHGGDMVRHRGNWQACRHAAEFQSVILTSGTASRRITGSTRTRESRRPRRARHLPQRRQRLLRAAGESTRPARPHHRRRPCGGNRCR